MNKTEHHKKAIVEALQKTLGVVTPALEITGVGRTTFYEWLKKDSDFKDQVESIGERSIDYVESKLFEQITEGNTTATIFFLKTKGKKRGYVERQEISHEGVQAFQIVEDGEWEDSGK